MTVFPRSLKTLKESGRLHFLAINGQHLQIPTEVTNPIFRVLFIPIPLHMQVFISEIIEKYLLDSEVNDADEGSDFSSDESSEMMA